MTGNPPTRPTTGRGSRSVGLLAAGAAGLVTLAVLAAGCTPRPATPAPQATPAPTAVDAAVGVEPDPHVDLDDPEQVCAAFAGALFAAAAGDRSQSEASALAAPYTTGELATAVVADHGRLPVSQQRSARRGMSVAAYVGDHLPPDTATVAHRAALVTTAEHGGTEERHVLYCTLHRSDARWLVAGYERERSLP